MRAIRDWPTPKIVSNVRSYGLAIGDLFRISIALCH